MRQASLALIDPVLIQTISITDQDPLPALDQGFKGFLYNGRTNQNLQRPGGFENANQENESGHETKVVPRKRQMFWLTI